jgi:hypothetical protein
MTIIYNKILFYNMFHQLRLLGTGLAQATTAYDAMTKAAKQAAETAEKNLTAAAAATFKAAGDAAETVKATTRGRKAA